jgi:chromosome segregation ATPase
LDILRQETPEDVERMRQEYKTLNASLVQKRDQAAQLEQKQRQIQELETTLMGFPGDLELQIKDKEKENEALTRNLTTVQAEITQIEGRMKLATEHRKRLDAVLKEIEKTLGQPLDDDAAGAINQAIQAIRGRVAEIQALDFQPIADMLDQAKQLGQIEKDEAELRQRLETVLEEVKEALGQLPGEDVAGALDQATRRLKPSANEQSRSRPSTSSQLLPISIRPSNSARLRETKISYASDWTWW